MAEIRGPEAWRKLGGVRVTTPLDDQWTTAAAHAAELAAARAAVMAAEAAVEQWFAEADQTHDS